MSFSLLPEFFAFLGVDIFVALSLLTCLLDDHFPKTLPWLFQAGAIGGYVHIFISKEFFTIFGDYMRFWYCLLYLLVALANVIALNAYIAVIKKHWTLAKVFSGTVVFPALLISGFFVSNYAGQMADFYVSGMAMLFSAVFLGVSISVLLSPRIVKKYWKRR
jgi:hypothetical protein